MFKDKVKLRSLFLEIALKSIMQVSKRFLLRLILNIMNDSELRSPERKTENKGKVEEI